MKCVLCAVGAVLLTACVPSLLAQAQPSPPKGLQVLSATLDIPMGQVTVRLHNASDKTIVAYVLETQGFDAQGNKIGEFRRIFDYIGPEPNPAKMNFIPPGQTGAVHYTRPEAPDPRLLKFHPESKASFDEAATKAAALDTMASVQVSILEVVYEDRTYEGNSTTYIGDIFDGRLRKLYIARQVLKSTLKDYPATREENREVMRHLQSLGFNAPEEALTREHWEAIRADVQRQAEWWEIQSKPQGATK
jgi:hypothetical protein